MTRLLALALCTLVAAAPTAWARPAKVAAQSLAEAKAAFKEATAAYDAGRFEDALKAFERAHELSRNPVLYFNLAACAEKLGQLRVAAAHLRAYLAEVPSADDAVKTRERLGALEERARLEDQHRAEEERRQEEEARKKKEAEERARTAVAVAAPAPAAPRRSIGRQYAGGFALLGVTVVLGATAAGLGGSALVKSRQLDDECGAIGCGDRVDPLRRQSIAADVFIGLTGAAALTTIILFAVESRRPRAERRTALLDTRGVQ